ncbi:MAG: hypothetical protein ACREQI_08190 [Candidatus Binataceae bacterium]
MPDRIANKIVLTEDAEQQNLVRRYLEKCGHNVRFARFVTLTAKASGGSGEKYVRDNYAKQVKACRSSTGKKASALLIVMIDADTETTEHRASQLADALKAEGAMKRGVREPIVVLIPKRHVETWIRALLGKTVDESTDYTKPQPTHAEIKSAAEKLHQWTRPSISPPAEFPPSLIDSMPEWRKISG